MQAIIDTLVEWGGNGKRNLSASFDGMTMERYLRLVAIVGAYFLLRPYLLKWGAKIQEKQHEKVYEDMEKKELQERKAAISPNALRGLVEVPEDSEEEDGGASTSGAGANWGKKARKRQRQTARKARQDELESESDPEIEQFLMDTYGKQNLKG
jgi:hypothetical protein